MPPDDLQEIRIPQARPAQEQPDQDWSQQEHHLPEHQGGEPEEHPKCSRHPPFDPHDSAWNVDATYVVDPTHKSAPAAGVWQANEIR